MRDDASAGDTDIQQIAAVVRSLNGTILHYDGVVSAETGIVRDLKLDSLAVMDFVMAVETKFQTVLPMDGIADVETIGDLAALLRARPTEPARQPVAGL